jgi:hypothetical protein
MPYLTPEAVLQTAVERKSGDLEFFVPSPVHEGIISLLTNLVVFGFVKEKYFPKVQETFLKHRSEVIAAMRPGFGQKVATRLVDAAIEGNRGKLLGCIRPARIAMSLRNLGRKPFYSLFAIVRHYSIVLGVRHSRRTLETISGDDSWAGASTGPVTSMVKIVALLVKDWRSQYAGRRNLTLRIRSDCFQDLLFNPQRNGYDGPIWFARLMGRFFPSPDLWILLEPVAGAVQFSNGATSSLLNLKSMEACRAFVKTRKAHAILSAAQSTVDIAEGAYAAIIDALAQRANKSIRRRL